jgi:hypothetical protein
MALLSNALVTLARAKDFIQPGGMAATDDARLEEVINRCSSSIEHHVGRRLMQVNYTGANVLYVQGPCYGTELPLDHSPIDITSPVTVTVDGTTQTVWRSGADGDQAAFDVVVMPGQYPIAPNRLARANGWHPTSAARPNNVTVDYKGGFVQAGGALNALPKDLEEAALEVIKLVWTDQSKGLQDVTTVSLPGGSFTLFSNPFPRRALQLLEAFRRLMVA